MSAIVKLEALKGVDPALVNKQISDYEFTCLTTMAIDQLISQELKGKCLLGPKLKTSDQNVIIKNTNVTPDILMEINGSPNGLYQGIAEIKTDLPEDRNLWDEVIKQLKKYDDVLTYNSTHKVNGHDLIFTTHELRTTPFKKFLDSKPPGSRISDISNLIIMRSNIAERVNQYLVLKAEYGTISNPDLDDILSNGVKIKLLGNLSDINQVKFVDSEPPVMYTMQLIWDHVLKNYITLKQSREFSKNKTVIVLVGIYEIREMLRRFCHDSNPECIRVSWVKKAMRAFWELGMAQPHNSKKGFFEVKIRRFKGLTISHFLQRLEEVKKEDKNLTLDNF